jgi:hypothetical protein
VKIHPDHVADDVTAAVRRALFGPVTVAGAGGLLRAEKLGPDGIVFLSHVVHAVMNVPGVEAVAHVDWDGTAFTEMGRRPAPGMHFDFEQGGIWINGHAE